MNNDIVVSICCSVYNHEKYLRQCIDGFINQKTEFRFEVLIHDDASTDESAKIIREYEKKYPKIIKPIFQTENQYSKGIKNSWAYQYPRAKGKYIALCEGDDFWTDPYKLQKQVEILESDNSISLCLHAVRCILENGNYMERTKPNIIGENQKYTSNDFIHYLISKHIMPFQTSSFVFRTSIVRQIISSIPNFISECNVGDVPLLLFLGYSGSVYYIAEEMSCYRTNALDNWNSRVMTNNDLVLSHEENIIETLNLYNIFTNNVFSNEINNTITKYEFDILYKRHNYNQLIKKKYRLLYNKLPRKERLYILINARCPCVYKKYKTIRNSRDNKI